MGRLVHEAEFIETRSEPTPVDADPSISVVVLTEGPSETFARLIRSLEKVTGIEQAELLVGLYGPDGREATRTLLSRHLPATSSTVETVPDTTAASAAAAVMPHARAELLLFLPDRIEAPVDLFARAQRIMIDPRHRCGRLDHRDRGGIRKRLGRRRLARPDRGRQAGRHRGAERRLPRSPSARPLRAHRRPDRRRPGPAAADARAAGDTCAQPRAQGHAQRARRVLDRPDPPAPAREPRGRGLLRFLVAHSGTRGDTGAVRRARSRRGVQPVPCRRSLVDGLVHALQAGRPADPDRAIDRRLRHDLLESRSRSSSPRSRPRSRSAASTRRTCSTTPPGRRSPSSPTATARPT